MIQTIDHMLDDDSCSNSEFDALTDKLRGLIKILPTLEISERIAQLPLITNQFVVAVCGGFSLGTHTITIRQYDALRQTSGCTYFRCGEKGTGEIFVIRIASGKKFGHIIKRKG